MNWKALLAMGIALIVIVSWTVIHGRATLPAVHGKGYKLVIGQMAC